MESISVSSLKLSENDASGSPENWRMRPSPDSPRKPVKSTAVVKYSTVQSLANFARLQCNTDLNMPPSNWLSSSAESYGLQPVPSHSSGFSSFRMAHMFPDCVGEVDVVSDAENIKKLLKIPYSRTPVSMMVHRVENTLLIDEFDIHKHLMRTAETEWEWLKSFFFDNVLKSLSEKDKGLFPKNNSRCALQQKSLVSKFLYHSLAVGEKQEVAGEDKPKHVNVPQPILLEGPNLPEPSLEEKVPDPSSNHKFARNVVWTFENIQMLIGTDLPIFGGTTHPCISLKLRDMSKPINVLTGIDYWLDNLMCNVPELVMCYHLNGIVQKYELIKTEDLPHMEDSKFSPKVIRDVAQNILSFLKSNATKAGHTYWLFKGKDDDAVKLYDLSSLCTADVMDEKGQNPFTVPVAMLLYRVARNMKHSSESRRQLGTIRMLLKNCVALLVKEKYPQIVTSAHYMLSDVYIPADTDPASPRFCEDFYEEKPDVNPTECEQDENEETASSSSSVAIKSLCLSMSESESGEDDRKYSNPIPINWSVEERCRMALQHVAEGLFCLQFFEVEDDRQQKADEERQKQNIRKKPEAENPNVARPFEAIPMPYSPLSPTADKPCSADVGEKKATNTKKKKKESRRDREAKSMNAEEEKLTDNSPRALLCKSKVEAMPTWQLHLKVLLYEKACLVYATLAETEYLSECYGTSLRYIASVLRCHRVFETLTNSVSNVGLRSYLLGRAGDCCFMIVQNWAQVDFHRANYMCLQEIDNSIMEEVKKDMSLNEDDFQLDLIPECINTLEQMLLASCECYGKALALEPLEKQRSNLRRRIGNIHNELGVLYMNQATQRFQGESESGKTAMIFQVLFSKSLHHLESGIHSFEAEGDDVNLALLHSNTGRLMRLCAHYHSPNARAELVGKERNFYNKAFTSYQKAIQVLGSRKNNPVIWDTVVWELSTTLFNMATFLQDYPTIGLKSTEEMEREVVEFLLKALKYCDLETAGTRQPVYQFRSATLHQRLASFYHNSFRSMSSEDAKRKNVLQLSRLHYDKASHLFLLLEHPAGFLRTQLEHSAIFEFQAQNAQTVSGKLKYYQSALDLIFQCYPMLKIIAERTQAVEVRGDSALKTPPKSLKAKQRSASKSCAEGGGDWDQVEKCRKKDGSAHPPNQEALPDSGTRDGAGESAVNEEDLAEQLEEYKMVKLLEQRFQFILLKLAHLYTSGHKPNQTKKELDALGQLYKKFYSMTLKKYSKDTILEVSNHLLKVLNGIMVEINFKPDYNKR